MLWFDRPWELGEWREWGYSLCTQYVSDLMLKKKLKPLIIESVVIVDQLGVIHL